MEIYFLAVFSFFFLFSVFSFFFVSKNVPQAGTRGEKISRSRMGGIEMREPDG